MSFNNLGLEIQNYLLFTNEYISKWFVFLVFLFLSVYYVFVLWPDQKPTTSYAHALMRLFFLGLSVPYLLSSPLIIILMSPAYSFYDFYMLPMKVYGIFMSIGTLMVVFDMFRYGPLVLMRLAGLDFGDENVNKIARQIIKNKHFVKLSKKGGMFGRR